MPVIVEDLTIPLPQGLRLQATFSANSPILPRFFAGYQRAFVLPDEREEMSGFVDCLALNQCRKWQEKSPFAEAVGILIDSEDQVLGGINFLAVKAKKNADLPDVTVALNYIFVEEAARGRGLLRLLLDAIEPLVSYPELGLHPTQKPAAFIELNDPFRLTQEEYAIDSAHSGLDQFDRLRIWQKSGALVVDYDYLQPPLDATKHADDGLILGLLNVDTAAIPASYLLHHLEQFFSISVLKGQPITSHPEAAQQLIALRQPGNVRLLPLQPVLEKPAQEIAGRYASFRDAARAIDG